MVSPIAAFRDPVRRPRMIIKTLVVVVVLAFVIVGSILGTSTAWFCNEVCHTVHLDNARQYAVSSHAQVSCIACHIPAGLDPIRFTLEKAEKITDVVAVLTDDFPMPLNESSHIALTMPASQCTQCHELANREITPSPGIIMNHDAHDEAELNCSVCHNRVAHPEVFDLELPGNEKHEDFMSMTACFRCHAQGDQRASEYEAPGACDACHPSDFELKPPSHFESGFYTERGESAGHAELAREEATATQEAREEWDSVVQEFRDKQPMIISRLIRIPHGELVDIPPVETVDECETCHVRSEFCDACHGIEIPHPAEFAEGHAEVGLRDKGVCATCHNKSGDPANDDQVCDGCHHDQGDPSLTWFPQHPGVVKNSGAQDCFACHRETFCSSCHVRGEPSTPY